MPTKICTVCKEERSLDEYHKNGNTRRTVCKYCCSKDKKDRTRSSLKNTLRRRAARLRIKEGLKCSICGESRPECLDFHHTNPEEKDSSISKLFRISADTEKLENELKKCIVLCANCHRAHHYNENLAKYAKLEEELGIK